ncbi:MAG: Uma2 family endonuclease [Acetobacteraceae bacterium]|nr:Uma2 family endonuclease [Acetobacteraceae bacterium]
MTIEEFLAWDAPGPHPWQLVEGEPRAMALASRTHGAIQAEFGALLGNHLAARSSPCSVIVTPGLVPRVRSNSNFRIPDLAVTCAGYATEEHALTEPVLVVEILSPSNAAETWSNIWSYTTMPRVREILVSRSATIGAELLRRNADGTWPERAEAIEEGELALDSIGFRCALTDIYRTTRLRAQD